MYEVAFLEYFLASWVSTHHLKVRNIGNQYVPESTKDYDPMMHIAHHGAIQECCHFKKN